MPYKEFVGVCTDYTAKTFNFEALVAKQKILQDGLVSDTTHEAAVEFDAIELFRTFKKFDRN